MSVDRDRGALVRKYGQGARCVMYVDEPGRYYDENGNELSKDIARQAGFDVEADLKLATQTKVKSRTEQQIATKFAEAEQRISEMSTEEVAGIRIIEHGGPDSFAIVDGSGNMACQILFNYDEAVEFYESVTGNKWVAPPEEPPAASEGFNSYTAKELRAMLKEHEVTPPASIDKAALVELAEEHLTLEDDSDDDTEDDDFL